MSALLAEFDSTGRVFGRFDVRSTSSGIVADCQGEMLDPARHRLGHEVKAITYHQLEFGPLPAGGWGGQVIVDL